VIPAGQREESLILNPYSPPNFKTRAELPKRLTIRRMILLCIIGTCGGFVLGAFTGVLNGLISPVYFLNVMNWNVDVVWPAAMREGMLEGSVYGFAYSICFIVLISVFSERMCRYKVALKYAFATLGLAFVWWIIGGIVAIILVVIFPDLRYSSYFGFHHSGANLIRYAWVRGSIWGIVDGGLLSVFLTNGCYWLRHQRGRKMRRPATGS